jgi:calcineurin-like phosphoesterase family protein
MTQARMSRAKRTKNDARAASGAGAAWSLGQSLIDPPPRSATGFLNKHFLIWVWNYLKVAFTPRHSFPTYEGDSEQKPGVYELPASCKVALAGDWGSGTENAYRVIDLIRDKQKPDMTIHLGDIYYSGQVDEVNEYFLGTDDWYRAKRSFALNANHEMYSGGNGYFDHVLPALDQKTSYFCIENDHWRIVAVDTGYYAKIFPFLELLLQTKLHSANLKWMREVIFSDDSDRRPVILLSHHQWFSAFDKGYTRVGNQLKAFLENVALWFWGHEHRFAGYAAYAPSGETKVRARCIGHGGMPVEICDPKHDEVPLVFVDHRKAGDIDGEPAGFCGNALLEFKDDVLTVRYFDEYGAELLVEEWKSGGRTGGVSGAVLSASKELLWFRDPNDLA